MSIQKSTFKNVILFMDTASFGMGVVRLANKVRYNVFYRQRPVPEGFHPVPVELLAPYNNARLLGPRKYLCHAPFVNMYFGVDGNVTACCYNRNFPFGNIQEQTISEMWHGEAANTLREHIQYNDLSKGCELCEMGIRSGSFNMIEAAAYDSTRPHPDIAYPRKMVFELSSTCNLACKMCTGTLSSTFRKHYENAEPYPDAYPPDFVQQLIPFLPNLKRANFLGGEPFLIDVYYQIWEQLLKVNRSCKLHVQTNGLILNNKVKALLEKGKFNIGISIDSLQEERFEEIRKFGNYKRWMANLEYFISYTKSKKTNLSLVFTPMIENMYEVPDFLAFSTSRKAYFYMNTLTEPEQFAIETLDLEELRKYLNFLNVSPLPDAKTYIGKWNLKVYRSYVNQIEHIVKTKEQQELERRAALEAEKRRMAEEEERIRKALAALSHLSFDGLKKEVIDRIKNEYRSSKYNGLLDLDDFIREFDASISEQQIKHAEEAEDYLRHMLISESENFGSALQPYIRKSMQKYQDIFG